MLLTLLQRNTHNLFRKVKRLMRYSARSYIYPATGTRIQIGSASGCICVQPLVCSDFHARVPEFVNN